MSYVIFDNYDAFLFDRPVNFCAGAPWEFGKIIDIPNGV
jgi:hypothetical protein